MNRFSKMTVAVLLLVSVLACSAAAQGRIATVDLRKVFDNYWKTKQADASLKDNAAEKEKQHKEMMGTWKSTKEEYQKLLSDANDQAVSQDEREKRKKSAEEKLKALKEMEESILQFERGAKTGIEEQKRRMRDNIVTEIRAAVNAKAKSSGYSLVIDSASESVNATPVILFTNGENDLTEDILKQINAGAPVETPKVEEKKDEKKK
jgi:outer membrane protein